MPSNALVKPAPSTPSKPAAATPSTESPGNWRHPQLAEITRRQNATIFSDSNARQIAINFVTLVALHLLRTGLAAWTPPKSYSPNVRTYTYYTYCLTVTFLVGRIIVSLLPLVRSKDELNDIPLTAGQRQLLGLPLSSAPPTPGSVYSTPPRYSRTPSVNGSVSSRTATFGSPTPAKASPLSGSPGWANGSPYSPAGSPLLHKAMGKPAATRSALESPSTSKRASPGLFSGLSSTPSPSHEKKTSVGLNNKWLYDRGRRLSGSPHA